MKYKHVSPDTYLLTEDDRIIRFKKYRYGDEKKPDPKECEGNLKGIYLAYAYCGEQDSGIRPMEAAFGATDKNRIIKKVPLELVESEGVRAIKFGADARLDDQMVKGAIKAGIIGYWDNSNLIICAAPEYGFVIDSIKAMFKPRQVRFGFNRSFAGCNLLILAI